MIRTSPPVGVLGSGGAVESYKALENVERVFRGLNTDLLIQPIRQVAPRVRAQVLIRLLAYYVTWHLQQSSRPGPAPRRSTPPPLARSSQSGRPARRSPGPGQDRH